MRKGLVICIALLSVVLLLGGCAGTDGTTTIKSDDDAVDAVEDISGDIDELTQDLDDINSELG
jgi:hypothetical protein